MGKPRIEGDLSARLPISGLWQAPPAGQPRTQKKAVGLDGETVPDKGEAAFDLRAAVRADPAGATLTDLALAFEQDGRPQLISGELQAKWRDVLSVEMSLASRWLDLDRIAGASEGAGPLDSVIPAWSAGIQIDMDVFESILQPGKFILLTSWRDAAAAEGSPPAGADIRQRRVRVIRDYGMFDRAEAPQYYPPVPRVCC